MSIILQPDDLAVGQIITRHDPFTPCSGPPFQILALNLPYLHVVAINSIGDTTAFNAIFDVRHHPLMAVPPDVITALRDNWLRVSQPAPVSLAPGLQGVPPSFVSGVTGHCDGSGPHLSPPPAI